MYNRLRPTTPHQINNISWMSSAAHKLGLWPRTETPSFTPGAGLSPVKTDTDRAERSGPAR